MLLDGDGLEERSIPLLCLVGTDRRPYCNFSPKTSSGEPARLHCGDDAMASGQGSIATCFRAGLSRLSDPPPLIDHISCNPGLARQDCGLFLVFCLHNSDVFHAVFSCVTSLSASPPESGCEASIAILATAVCDEY